MNIHEGKGYKQYSLRPQATCISYKCESLFWGLCYQGIIYQKWECSGSVVECLTRDRGVAGSGLTVVTALCP